MFISYTEDLTDLISSHQLKYHEFADDTQLVGRTEIPKVPSTIDSLQRCTADVGDWCASRCLKLNEDKTEFMWCGSRASLKKIASNDLFVATSWQRRHHISQRCA